MYFTEVNEDDYNDYFTFNKFLWEQSAWEFFSYEIFFSKRKQTMRGVRD